jgi:hypothetical protein
MELLLNIKGQVNKMKKETTNLLEDLEDIVSQLQIGKIDEKQTIEVLNNIVNYEKELEFKKNNKKEK